MDLISREALKELLQHNRNSLKGIGGDEYALKAFDYCIKRIDEQPTIESVPVENIKRIVERFEEVAKDYADSSDEYGQGKYFSYSNAAEIVKKEGGL